MYSSLLPIVPHLPPNPTVYGLRQANGWVGWLEDEDLAVEVVRERFSDRALARFLIDPQEPDLTLEFTRFALVLLTTTGANTWTVPGGWSNSTNWVDCYGAGGTGGPTNTSNGGGGGGGGAYSRTINIVLTVGTSVNYQVAAGGSQVGTWFSSTTTAAASTGQNGTNSPGGINAGGGAGLTGFGAFVGSFLNDGGGGSRSMPGSDFGGGGGGAGGPAGAGQTPAGSPPNTPQGAAGDAGFGGAGGSQGNAGGNGAEFGTFGSGGGGGGGGIAGNGAPGGLYGGGGGGAGPGGGTAGAGSQGLVVVFNGGNVTSQVTVL